MLLSTINHVIYQLTNLKWKDWSEILLRYFSSNILYQQKASGILGAYEIHMC